jgi:glycosyltransferase involved in cell wall biosynthesis
MGSDVGQPLESDVGQPLWSDVRQPLWSPSIRAVKSESNKFEQFRCKKHVFNTLLDAVNDFYSSDEQYTLIIDGDPVLTNISPIYKIIDRAPNDWNAVVLADQLVDNLQDNLQDNIQGDYVPTMTMPSNDTAYILNRTGAEKIIHGNTATVNSYISTRINQSVNPFFSIILPVYNGINYIKQAVDSITNQAFTDFELIIVNDGSTDKTADYLDTLKSDPKIYVINQQNQKTANAINNGINRSSGRYITWSSHDNLLHPDFLLEYHKILNGSNIHFIYGGSIFFGTDNWLSNPGLLNSRQLFFGYPGIASFMWSADTIHKVGRFNANLHGIEDLDYVWRTIEYNPQIYAVKKMLYRFRMHNEQATYDFDRNNKWTALIRKMLELFVERNGDNLDNMIHSFYPYIDSCVNKQRAICIAFYELATKIVSEYRQVYRDVLYPLATVCLKKSYEYDNTFTDALNLLNHDKYGQKIELTNFVDIADEELFVVERELMKSHEFN